MTVRQNDERPIPRQQLRFVSEVIAYVFMNSKFAVTTDRGATWFVWDATHELSDWHQSYLYVQEVSIDTTGVGTLTLLPFSESKVGVPVLHTKDYGRQWSAK